MRAPDEEVEPQKPAVSIRAQPSVVELRSGDSAQVRVAVTNHTTKDEIYQISLRQDVPVPATVEPSDSISVPAGETADATLTLQHPTHQEITGPVQMSIRVNSTKEPDNAAAQFIEIRPISGPVASWSVTQPRLTGLRSATYEVVLTNRGKVPISVAPAIDVSSDELIVAVEPTPVEVGAQSSTPVSVRVEARSLNWGGQSRRQLTLGGGEGVVENSLDLFFSQLSAWWTAGAGIAVLVFLVAFLVAGLLGDGTADTTIIATETTTTTSVATTTTTEPPTTTTTAPTTTTTVPGDLALAGYEMVRPECVDEYIIILYSAAEPGQYESEVSEYLDKYSPDAEYLRTDQSCSSLRQSVNGNAIYAVFDGPFATPDEACAALPTQEDEYAPYVLILSLTVPREDARVDC